MGSTEKLHISATLSAEQIADMVDGRGIEMEGDDFYLVLGTEELDQRAKERIAQRVVSWL